LNPPAWSLEIEFQFYVLAPAIILFALAVGRPWRSFAAEVLTMAGVVVAMKLMAEAFAPQELRRFLVSNFVEFFVLGFVLSRLYARGVFRDSRLGAAATPLFLGGLCLAWYADHLGSVNASNNEPLIRLMMLTSFAAVFAGALSGGVGRWFTSATWIATIGGMCYTIYLIHLSFLQVATRLLFRVIPVHDLLSGVLVYGLVLIPLLLAASIIFFLLVEKPCMDPQWPQKLLRMVGCLPPAGSSAKQVD
jgi:peptidoglycan/LPS O-acetylase OafA/YrhL